MAIAKSFDVYLSVNNSLPSQRQVPVPVYYALMRTDKLLVVLFEMKKMISGIKAVARSYLNVGNVMQDLASHLVNDICAHFTSVGYAISLLILI